jgi:hypothetical protein
VGHVDVKDGEERGKWGRLGMAGDLGKVLVR